jgi:hypothetical protein
MKLRRMRWADMQHARKNTGVPTRSWLEYLKERDLAVNCESTGWLKKSGNFAKAVIIYYEHA